MKSKYYLVVMAVCFGLLLTWGILRVSASMYSSNQELSTQSAVEVSESLTVYAENANGQPAINASVYAYTTDGDRADSATTGADGYADLNLSPGTYTIVVYSFNDHFFIYQTNVSPPGSISMTAVGASQVTLTARKNDGYPLMNARVSVGITGGDAWNVSVGWVNYSNSQLIFYVTPGVYDVGVWGWSDRYALYTVGQDFTNPNNMVDFDMTKNPYAVLIIDHPNDTLSYVRLIASDGNIGYIGFSNLEDGDQIVLSTNLGYYATQIISRKDGEGNTWDYYFDLGYEHSFDPYEYLTFSAGGTLSATGRTDEAYVGEVITLTNVVDVFGGYLTHIYTYTPEAIIGEPVFPQVELIDPNAQVTHLQSLEYNLPLTAPTGMYSVNFEWDTGPYQGLLTEESQFEVVPQCTSAVIPPEGGTLYSAWDDTLYEFAPDSFIDTVTITHTVRYVDIPPFAPLVDIEHFYDLVTVYSDTGLPAQPSLPYTITIGFTDKQIGPAIEDSLGLYNWDGAQWVLEPTGLVDPVNNQVIATPNHFSIWGIQGETNRVFLAFVNR